MAFNPECKGVPTSKIDHVSITAPKDQFEPVVEWYKKALAPLNYKEIMRFPGAVGLGDQVPDFWISQTDSETPQNLHFAFTSPDHKTVDAFYEAAIAAGGKCNGKPGLRPQYHPNYYGAFVFDPRGNNVELVCHLPSEE
ncbi:hypothetical protein P175DRAFT_0496837 [Aspergillus ochraceoroseus IBT 24754]|uniref:VOC domain-containing protein n=3 Tax=Aspergillus subgen. Nidulantes TaxID=2720870 RepID=A0A0F8VTQ5_9EURO|nr:uncharacterized protein P175DRAFT_0496837 [Aspergillus ochraceoroseus IBT 24754]KKK21436.1 hypothetical protein AOCH_000126 [Aspergillus ochraceoroseus]KKK26601.1 hypothetical protein ARAM_005861 [Aspergillus rambellii]PTU23684.1 hypothetical protein P175DRAFT_0496837 [Aspergillus ochraceoroseus IBT 24754]